MKALKLSLALPLAALFLPLAMSAATWSSSGQYAVYTFANGVSVNNDVWGSGAGPETLYVNESSESAPNFWAVSDQPDTSGVKAYPHAAWVINKAINSLSTLTGTWNTSGTAGQYDWAFDCWVPSEVMVWTQWGGGSGPWGTLYQSNVSIGGATYNVYEPGGPWSFLRTSQSSSSSANLAAIFKWLVSNGHLANGTVGSCQYGVEISQGNSAWTVNSCNIAQ